MVVDLSDIGGLQADKSVSFKILPQLEAALREAAARNSGDDSAQARDDPKVMEESEDGMENPLGTHVCAVLYILVYHHFPLVYNHESYQPNHYLYTAGAIMDRQASAFLDVISTLQLTELQTTQPATSARQLVVPSALALHSLLERDWAPKHNGISTGVISCLSR